MTSKTKSKKSKGGSRKGSPFEREFCVMLSEWITCGVTDEAFWRSQASGARHTQRSKQGRATTGQAGDIAATLPEFAFVTQRVVWELKRGYKELNLQRLLEAPATVNTLEHFITKLVGTVAAAGAAHWVFVSRRDNASTVVWLPSRLARRMRAADPAALQAIHGATIHLRVPPRVVGSPFIEVFGITSHDFFETNPATFIAAIKQD